MDGSLCLLNHQFVGTTDDNTDRLSGIYTSCDLQTHAHTTLTLSLSCMNRAKTSEYLHLEYLSMNKCMRKTRHVHLEML